VAKGVAQGYSADSVDGRRHSAISEAACRGHGAVLAYLLAQGGDPNLCSDTGRSPLYRWARHTPHTHPPPAGGVFATLSLSRFSASLLVALAGLKGTDSVWFVITKHVFFWWVLDFFLLLLLLKKIHVQN
jgi:hypothetical protein